MLLPANGDHGHVLYKRLVAWVVGGFREVERRWKVRKGMEEKGLLSLHLPRMFWVDARLCEAWDPAPDGAN